MLVFYHNDHDGKCSAAIVKKAYKNEKKILFVEMDYNTNFDIDSINDNECIVVVDYSFKPELMEKILEKTYDVTWIDHHKTALDYKYSTQLVGVREEGNKASCVLTWEYYFPNTKIPFSVRLISDRDSWTWKYKITTEEFTEGLRTLGLVKPNDKVWNKLFDDHELVKHVVRMGKVCVMYRNSLSVEYLEKYGFETELDTRKAIAVNMSLMGNLVFCGLDSKYDIAITFSFDGELFKISLFSDKVDVSEIAKKYGGGGHPGAAGFFSKNLPFKKLSKDLIYNDNVKSVFKSK